MPRESRRQPCEPSRREAEAWVGEQRQGRAGVQERETGTTLTVQRMHAGEGNGKEEAQSFTGRFLS